LTNPTKHSLPLLLVEDSPEDRVATIRAFQKCGMLNPIISCVDGDDALDFLYRRGKYGDSAKAPRPGVILLDLNLPGTDGRQVLVEIKRDPDLKTIPVVILSTSTDARDIGSSYHAGASSYVRKPVNVPDFMLAMQRFKDWWFDVVILDAP
jgi:CheY-like chemotaxis protein